MGVNSELSRHEHHLSPGTDPQQKECQWWCTMKLSRHLFAVEFTPGAYILRGAGALVNWSLCKGKWPKWPGTWKSFIKETSEDSEKAWPQNRKRKKWCHSMSEGMLSEKGSRLILGWVVGQMDSRNFREADLNTWLKEFSHNSNYWIVEKVVLWDNGLEMVKEMLSQLL